MDPWAGSPGVHWHPGRGPFVHSPPPQKNAPPVALRPQAGRSGAGPRYSVTTLEARSSLSAMSYILLTVPTFRRSVRP